LKKILTLMAILLLGTFALSGCVRSHSFFYDYDELTQNLIRAEIVYMESDVIFFDTHWYVDVVSTDYEIIKELTDEETAKLIYALSNMRFTYRTFLVPVSVSNVFRMQGYVIKLYYEPNLELPYGGNPFILLAQTGDYRYGLSRFGQARAGRVATNEDWNALISEFHSN